jgi:hypothetical protein
VAGLVGGYRLLLLEDDHGHPGPGQLPGDRQAQDSGPDDADGSDRPARAFDAIHATLAISAARYHANLTAAVLMRV